VLAEAGRRPESVFGIVQGIITAVAHRKSHQEIRLEMEAKAKKIARPSSSAT
jgi:hypothetical protein